LGGVHSIRGRFGRGDRSDRVGASVRFFGLFGRGCGGFRAFNLASSSISRGPRRAFVAIIPQPTRRAASA
jgi:hypothetical protein